MENRYVDVAITRDTNVVSVAGSGVSLLIVLGTSVKSLKEYTTLSGVLEDYPINTEGYRLARAVLNHSPKPEKIAIAQISYAIGTDTPATVVEKINDVVEEYPDFFALHTTSTDTPIITAISNYNVGSERIYAATTSDISLVTTLSANDNTFLAVTQTPGEQLASALIGKISAYEVGSYTATFETLPGYTPDKWSESELAQIETGATAYIREGGVNIISKGVTTSGEYLDIIIGQYYLKNRITEAVYNVLVTQRKVSQTNRGIQLVATAIEGVLKRNANTGLIALDDNDNPMYNVSVPDISQVSAQDKANRVLNDVVFEATLDGAFEKVKIRGTLGL